jgi:alpha-glucosidase
MARDDTPPFDGVVYQIYPRSFRDTTGDGVGDLSGVIAGLDHLAWLGVDALWLSPIYRSPMADFGYDVADHADVDPVFGTLADADRLIEEAHARGIQVWLDWVPNHTSDQHPWFRASRSSRDDPKRGWYVWRDPMPDGGPPNNWRRAFEMAPAWTLDEATGQYYLHQFLPEQPDVDWSDPDLRAAMLDVLRFWMKRGVDGFRADVVHLIGKDPDLPDDPPHLQVVGRAGHHHVPEVTNAHLREVRAVLDGYPGRTMVGEINLPDAAQVVEYVGPDRLHLSFHFGLIYAPWEARSWRDTIRYVDARFAEVGASPAWVLGNHDQPRVRSRLGSEARARAAITALLTLRGVPFLYAGDELGLADADVPPERRLDPGHRDGCRAPIPWTSDRSHGWAGTPWLPWPPEADGRDPETLRRDPSSTLNLHRRLIALRRATPALRSGDQEVVDVHDDVLAVRRGTADGSETDERLVLVNTVTEAREVALPERVAGAWAVELASDQLGATGPFEGWLDAEQALVLRRP